jgi:hypothetical protein
VTRLGAQAVSAGGYFDYLAAASDFPAKIDDAFVAAKKAK